MIYGSLCSGIEAATVAWKPLGWKAQWFSQFDPEHNYENGPDFPSAVLDHHYPEVLNLGDMTKLHESEVFNERPIELLVGGCPCQSFSVAGLRKGLADPRGNLTLHFLKILDAKRPRWMVYENVPGIFSSLSHDAPDPCPPPPPVDLELDGQEVESKDDYDSEEFHALGCFLAGLSELGYGWSYVVLNSEHFGVPQRRRRIFVVGYSGELGKSADQITVQEQEEFSKISASVLFDSVSLSRDSPPSRKKGQGSAADASSGPGVGGHGIDVPEVADTLRSGSSNKSAHGKLNGTDRMTLVPEAFGGNRTSGPLDVATAVNAKGGTGRSDFESETFITGALQANGKAAGSATQQDAESGMLIPEVTHSLRADGFDASEDGTGRGTPLVPVAFNGAQDPDVSGDVTHPLGTNQGQEVCVAVPKVYDMRGNGNGDVVPNLTGDHASRPTDYTPMVFEARVARNGRGAPSDIVPPLKAESGEDGRGDGSPLVAFTTKLDNTTSNHAGKVYEEYAPTVSKNSAALLTNLSVRRLTPKECARLQGFPDDYLDIIFNGKPAADGNKYKALGNSMTTNVMAWIGNRIQMVDDLLRSKKVRRG